MSRKPDSRSNVCHVELDISWELAGALVPHLSNILNALVGALQNRQVDHVHDVAEREGHRVIAAQNKAGWAALAAECEAEIARRANGPGQRNAIIKQLALERNVTREFLRIILKANGREAKTAGQSRHQTAQRTAAYQARTAEILRLRIDGKSTAQIAAVLGISARQVRNYIADATREPEPPAPKPVSS